MQFTAWIRARGRSLIGATLAVATVAGDGNVQAGTEEDRAFFAGKTIEYIVSHSPGGGYDVYARLIARHLEKHLPGTTIAVRNVTGAGGIIGAAKLYGSKPDGLTIGTFNTGLIASQLVGIEGLRFDLRDFDWIGKASTDPRVLVVSTHTSYQSMDDLRRVQSPLLLAANGVGGLAYAQSLIFSSAADFPIKVVPGFLGTEAELAMIRGDVEAHVAAYTSMAPFVANGHGRIIFQLGARQPHPAATHPSITEYVSDPDDLRVLRFMDGQCRLMRLTAAPPGVPPERLAVLREAYMATLSDPEFLAEAERLGLSIDPMEGSEVAAAVAEMLDQPPAIVDRLRELITRD